LDKAPDAFRTISEVASDLDIPQHVLRFWETRFAQIKPMKRSGGRRYYRPDDVDLLRGIRRLLYGEGYTIRGVQRILKEHGVKSVQRLADANATPSFGAVEEEIGRSLAEHDDTARPPAPEIDDDDDDYDGGAFGDDFSIAPHREHALQPSADGEDDDGDGPILGVEHSAHPFDLAVLEGLLADLIACRQLLDAAMDDTSRTIEP
jgi:DNA-binding transcriptional MerR regulator